MKELKINPRFENFSPKKKPDEIEKLKISLKENGYQGLPILTWKDYIVDGHNRYKYCKELGIDIPDDKIVPLGILETEDEIAIIHWIAHHHFSSKNLTDGEKLALKESLEEEIRRDNAKKRLEGNSLGGKGGTKVCVQMDADLNMLEKSRDRSTNTREQVSKLTGVSTGNIARYDAVMRSNNEELKKKVKNGEVKIGTAYREIKEKEETSQKKESEDSYKNITNQYSGTQKSGHFGEYYDTEKTTDKIFTEEDVIKAYRDTKTTKNALDMLDVVDEIDTLKEDVNGRLTTYKNRLFNVYHIQDKISNTEMEYANKALNELIDSIKEIIKIIKGE